MVHVPQDLYTAIYSIKSINALLLKIIIPVILFVPIHMNLLGQPIARDSTRHQQLAEVTVVAAQAPANTDNVIQAKQIAMPVTIISRQKIAQMGSRRLDEVLREQTGMAVVSDLGAGNRAVGLQMQG